jgi:hypothetical protein
MEHAGLDLFGRQLGNIEQWQDFRLYPETANTPVRRIWHSLSGAAKGQANAKSKAALAKMVSRAAFDLKFLTELAAKNVGTSNRRHEPNERYSGPSQAELVAATVRWLEANLELAWHCGGRSRHQAQA